MKRWNHKKKKYEFTDWGSKYADIRLATIGICIALICIIFLALLLYVIQ